MHKKTYFTFSLIHALCTCFSVCRISSAAIFVDRMWEFWMEALESVKHKVSWKMFLVTRIHYHDATDAALVHTWVAPYYPEYNLGGVLLFIGQFRVTSYFAHMSTDQIEKYHKNTNVFSVNRPQTGQSVGSSTIIIISVNNIIIYIF